MLARWAVVRLAVLAGLGVLSACTADTDPTTTAGDTVSIRPDAVATQPDTDSFDQRLHDELIAMRDDDQAFRRGQPGSGESDEDRAQRLAETIDEYGWPSSELVARKGVGAAWLIAQHADFDVQFQQRILR